MKIERLDTPKHALDIEQLTEALVDEYGSTHEYKRAALNESCYRCVADNERRYLNAWIAYDVDDHPVGFICATAYRSFYSYRMFTSQEMWYVVPRARGTRAAAQLLLAYERWALSMKAERIYTQVEHDNEPTLVDRILNLLEFLGYSKQGYIAVKRPRYSIIHKDKDNDRTTHRGVGTEQEPAQI